MNPQEILNQLQAQGNLRTIPPESTPQFVDLSSNDYLGLAARADLRSEFLAQPHIASIPFSAAASRLLGARQREFDSFENLLAQTYGRPALLANSGYHANVGTIQALAALPKTLILADRLVHASIIDGIRLSGAKFQRFRHNDFSHLETLIRTALPSFDSILVIAESVYSMDGDRAPINTLIDLKRLYGPQITLYVDEAHALGVEGPSGLGLVQASKAPHEVDIVVGTLGKALASVGAFVLCSPTLRAFLVNRSRSLIFSTALPPLNTAWSEFIFRRMLTMHAERQKLALLSQELAKALHTPEPSHIRPLIVGNPKKAVLLSTQLARQGFKVLPIRTPTVPPGTERLRFSLSAAIEPDQIQDLAKTLESLWNTVS